jgi:hypothetical protein
MSSPHPLWAHASYLSCLCKHQCQHHLWPGEHFYTGVWHHGCNKPVMWVLVFAGLRNKLTRHDCAPTHSWRWCTTLCTSDYLCTNQSVSNFLSWILWISFLFICCKGHCFFFIFRIQTILF